MKVSYTSVAMTLLDVQPAQGWTVGETDVQPDEIEVSFDRHDEDGSHIHLRLVDGVPEKLKSDD